MKKIFVVIMVTMIVARSGAQRTEVSIQKPYVDYLKKSEIQKSTAFVLLGSGAAMFTGGVIGMQHSQSKGEIETKFMLGGLVSGLASIPFFNSARINKHKAKIYMKHDALMITPNYDSNISYNSIGFRINI